MSYHGFNFGLLEKNQQAYRIFDPSHECKTLEFHILPFERYQELSLSFSNYRQQTRSKRLRIKRRSCLTIIAKSNMMENQTLNSEGLQGYIPTPVIIEMQVKKEQLLHDLMSSREECLSDTFFTGKTQNLTFLR